MTDEEKMPEQHLLSGLRAVESVRVRFPLVCRGLVGREAGSIPDDLCRVSG